MKPAIRWVDEVFEDNRAEGRMMPSQLLGLVNGVRAEVLDAVELLMRRQGTFAEGSDAAALQADVTRHIVIWRGT